MKLVASVCVALSMVAMPVFAATPQDLPLGGRVPLTSSSPTHQRLNDSERETLKVATLALSSAWIGAVIDVANRVEVRGFAIDIWPDSDDDLDSDADIALRRRWYLAAASVVPVADAHRRVIAACLRESDGTATIFAVGDTSIAVIDTSLSPLPLSKGRALPLAMPTVTVRPVVGDVGSTMKALTKGRPCVPVQHRGGVIDFNPETLTLKLSAREHRQRLRFACTDAASIVAAADRFVDLLSRRSRDTVHALPQPFAHPSIAAFSTGLLRYTLPAMNTVGAWIDEAGGDNAIRPRRTDSAVLLLDRTDDGRPIQAEVRLRAGTTTTSVALQIFDDTCSLNGVPFPWSPYKPTPGEKVSTDEVSGWVHAGTTWVAGPAPDVVNGRTTKAK